MVSRHNSYSKRAHILGDVVGCELVQDLPHARRIRSRGIDRGSSFVKNEAVRVLDR